MHRIGLALSGGGFRATLFHLGMIRFLREANILPNVTQITSVSGGSILAAHLVQNWQRYTGSLKDFDAAAAEILRFVQLDIRNRVVRRYPLAMPLRGLRRLALRRPCRQLTRTGLLEYHYEKFLFGDTCLFQLPDRPRLYMLATNLSEGCLCAFTRDGLLMQRRRPGQRMRFERIHTGLATIPMAVTASSAFPGFFPPLELQASDVGANPGQFGRLAFTDGGVYDNLGVRMFRCLERSWMASEVRLELDDLSDPQQLQRALAEAAAGPVENPLRRLSHLLSQPRNGMAGNVMSESESVARLVDGLWDVLNHENLARDPAFSGLSLNDADVETLIRAAQQDERELEGGERLWLNRQLVQNAVRQVTGRPCFRSENGCFDSVLVSDAGKEFQIVANARAGGLISTSMRASDILMDRVWQLEVDTFSGTPGFVFAPISRCIDREEDPTAAHPEIQRRAAEIRTDLDRFSPLEISALIRHGYCVGRSACRSRPDLFGTEIPADSPWDPMSTARAASPKIIPPVATVVPPIAPVTQQSRTLQHSAVRRIWSTLLDYRDWISYIYVPLLVPILLILPYYGVKWYRQSQINQQLVESMAQSNQDYAVMNRLLQDGTPPLFEGMPMIEVRELTPPDYSGLEVIADLRVLDMRRWMSTPRRAAAGQSSIYGYRRFRLRKLESTANRFVVKFRLDHPRLDVRSLNPHVPARLRVQRPAAAAGRETPHLFEVEFDLSKIPPKEVVDLALELQVREPQGENQQSVNLYVDTETGLLSAWLLMPDDKRYQNFNLLRYPKGNISESESVAPAQQLNVVDGHILAFTLLSVEPDFTYECRWTFPEKP
ncbi:patatin-like phospholipase family protein [Planctomicrobium piriforme]|uniref:Patatin-like phospholipase n=1 Tax=Planctomicrobium piriforme TaxID=1576369 RepID=A0A1I3SIZ2_9PLAN|nr:patatin-like phospholipase family protein [Planctomicrobium piriforme]SFJ58694.1 Patatin-like phospholipase [Planctomicrobium piriforme]